MAHDHGRWCLGVGHDLGADIGGDGGQIGHGDLPGVAAPAIDQYLRAATFAGGDGAREIHRDGERGDHLATVDQLVQLLLAVDMPDVGDEAGAVQALYQLVRPPPRILIVDGDIDVTHFQRRGKGEHQQLQDRRHEHHHAAARVAQDAEHFLDELGAQAGERECGSQHRVTPGSCAWRAWRSGKTAPQSPPWPPGWAGRRPRCRRPGTRS
ncbi:hypothetical protein SDC9_183466 [bioreactor metagenome]|uniref:Uncharacterized protein n=1 Tax=bioreactor metagenome TaxID=1076179 RepID=A0A645HAA3_9ZZZZ